MGPPEAPQAVSVGLRNCYLALPKRHKLFLYWASKLLSGTFSAPLKSLKTLPAAFDGLSLLCHGACHGSSRGPTSCFCWASKLLSGTSEARQAVSIGLRNCYLARFQHPLKASKPSKPSQQLSTAFRCFAMGPPEAPQAVSVGLRNCYLARCSFRRPFAALPWVLPRPHELFLYWASKLLSGTFSSTLKSCFYWASKLLSGTLQLSTAFRCFAMGPPEAPQAVGCFCWASKLLSDTFPKRHLRCFYWLRNCYLARFQHCLKSFAMGPQNPPSELFLTAFRNCFAMGHFRGATSCFYWASKMLSGTLQLSTAIRCFAMGPPEAPRAVSVGLRNCYLALPRCHKLFLLGFETAIWHIFRTP